MGDREENGRRNNLLLKIIKCKDQLTTGKGGNFRLEWADVQLIFESLGKEEWEPFHFPLSILSLSVLLNSSL